MRKLALLSTILLVGLVAGCKAESPSPTPTIAPTDTDTPETPAVVSPSGPATCVVAPFEFPVNPNIPPISEADHVHGSEDAPIIFIEYADFQ